MIDIKIVSEMGWTSRIGRICFRFFVRIRTFNGHMKSTMLLPLDDVDGSMQARPSPIVTGLLSVNKVPQSSLH